MPSRTIIFANGSLPDLEPARRLIRPGDTLIAADGGTRHALALGLTPQVILGDLDSLPRSARYQAEQSGVRIIEYPRDKNETDLELAINFTIEQGSTEIIILAALGGRLDQTLGNLSLLTAPQLSSIDIRLDDGVETAFFMREQAQVWGRPGDLVSLIPWGADVTGVCTDGLRWPLNGETLHAHQSRGISNELLSARANIRIESGLLLVVHRRQAAINPKNLKPSEVP